MKLLGFLVGLVVAGALFFALTDPYPPSETAEAYYERYRAAVLEGRSFEEEAAFHTQERQDDIAAQLARMGEDAERAKQTYLTATARQMACFDLTLSDKTERDGLVWLTYDAQDTCGDFDAGQSVQEVVGLVRQGGWKIAVNETRIEN